MDINAQLAVRQRISQVEADMRRHTDAAQDAATALRRAVNTFETPAGIDLEAIDAATIDLRLAKSKYTAALRERNELKAQIGEG